VRKICDNKVYKTESNTATMTLTEWWDVVKAHNNFYQLKLWKNNTITHRP